MSSGLQRKKGPFEIRTRMSTTGHWGSCTSKTKIGKISRPGVQDLSVRHMVRLLILGFVGVPGHRLAEVSVQPRNWLLIVRASEKRHACCFYPKPGAPTPTLREGPPVCRASPHTLDSAGVA